VVGFGNHRVKRHRCDPNSTPWNAAGARRRSGCWVELEELRVGGISKGVPAQFFCSASSCSQHWRYAPGFYFRYHYFIFALPAVSLLVGVAISQPWDLLAGRMTAVRFVPLLLLGAALSLPVLWDKEFFFEVSPVEACRLRSGSPSRLWNTCATTHPPMRQSQYWDRSRRFIFIHSDIRRPDIFTLTV
jgi:hypothetical protein